MERLTIESPIKDSYVLNPQQNIPNVIVEGMIYNKLGKLEDLEEQLGCPLEVFVKLISIGELWCEDERMHFNGGDYGKIVGSPKWEERFKCETAPIHFSFDDEDLKETEFWAWYHYCSNGSDHIVLKLKDYGKTWWLKEDKSE